MMPMPEPVPRLRLERATGQALVEAPVPWHLIAEHVTERQRWRFQLYPIYWDYCQEQYCWTMTWALG